MEETPTSFAKAWKQIQQEPTVWEHLKIKDQAFYYDYGKHPIFLSSFQTKDLPTPPYELKFLGKILTRLSHFANIMSRRPGTEEVTFYAILNSPQKGIFGSKLDEKMLNVAAPPLAWRREQIKKVIKQKVERYLQTKESFLFLDIGCGAGFDSLEIERLVHRIKELTGNVHGNEDYASLNIDIDSKWLENNRRVTEKLFGDDHHIMRENISAFDFLSDNSYQSTLKPYDHLIISCNGFAEFLSDSELQKLYREICELTDSFEGSVCVLLPFANKNEKQEAIGNKIGFQFRAKEKNEIIAMIEEIFVNYRVSSTEQHSQIVMCIEK